MFSCTLSLFSQEQLEVEGLVHSKVGGFKFPDNTVQGTAAAKLTGEEIAQARGRVTASYTSISGVNSATEFDVLGVNFVEGQVSNIASFGLAEITHDIDGATLAHFMFEYARRFNVVRVNLSYFDANNVKYLTIRLKGTVAIDEFAHQTVPFSTTSFGHVFSMKIKYNQLEIKDELNDNCRCWDVNTNAACACL